MAKTTRKAYAAPKAGDIVYRAILVEPPEGSSTRAPYKVDSEYQREFIGSSFVTGPTRVAVQQLARDLAGVRGMSGALEISIRTVRKPKH